MPDIRLDDVTMIYPFQKVTGLFDRKQKQLMLEQQKKMPYTSNEGVIALQHFSATITDGEFVAVMGPSGSGKTTLLRVIAGLERPPVGKVFFGEEDVTYAEMEDRDVAMVFQNYSLYPNQTVYSNIAFPLEVRHTPREEIDREVKQIAELLGISDKLKRLSQDLSGGEKQRVAIARALIRKPAVLLLDEPFANLDILMKARIRKQLKQIHQAYKTTFIYVTHDQYDALSLADRIIILKDGITQMDDSTVNVYNYPANRFCGEFLGFPVMNMFEDLTVNSDGRYELMGEKFALTSQQRRNLKGNRITVGIRGTNISIGDGKISGEVLYTELIESDLMIHVKTGDSEITVVEKAGSEAEVKYLTGQTVKLMLDTERFHIFDYQENRI